jgi:hypothetical protein
MRGFGVRGFGVSGVARGVYYMYFDMRGAFWF